MAFSLLSHEISDLCLGKPALKSLSLSTTIAEVLSALKNSDDNFLSVWSCDHSRKPIPIPDFDHGINDECRCVGKVSMVDVICFLCKEENLLSPSAALKAPVSVLLPQETGLVVHLEPSSSLLEAIDLILEGAKNLVVPIRNRFSSISRRKQHQKMLAAAAGSSSTIHNGQEFCWFTQEDIIRYFLSSIGQFSPLSASSIDSLDIMNTDFITTEWYSPASSAVDAIYQSLADQTSVAVIDSDGILIGEVSPSTLSCCDESVAAAITTLSCGDLMAYIDCGGPPEDLVRLVMARLKERGLEAMLQEFINTNSGFYASSTSSISCSSLSCSSSDEESPSTILRAARKYNRSMSYSARMVRRAEAIVCSPNSSLVAVMIQAIAHRVNYVWVVEDDCSLVGIVRFCDMLKVFRDRLLEDMDY